MLDDIRFELQTLDHRALTSGQLSHLKQRLTDHAHIERNEAIYAAIPVSPGGLQRLLSLAGRHAALWFGVQPTARIAALKASAGRLRR